ncbi:MAG TPA: hypothetical protein VLM80_08005, partial [Anaerolineales bacterium]|nr:hypothetical protein [Anaerolineales bacterium]
MVRIRILVFLLLLAVGCSSCAPVSSGQPSEQVLTPQTAANSPVEPTQKAQDQVTAQPVIAWPEQPVLLATGSDHVPV